jgi:hypothetical protein
VQRFKCVRLGKGKTLIVFLLLHYHYSVVCSSAPNARFGVITPRAWLLVCSVRNYELTTSEEPRGEIGLIAVVRVIRPSVQADP